MNASATRPTPEQMHAATALFAGLDADTRRLTLKLLWRFTPYWRRAAPALRCARRFAPKTLKGLAAAPHTKGGAR